MGRPYASLQTEEAKIDSLQREREQGWNQSAEEGSNKTDYHLHPFLTPSYNPTFGFNLHILLKLLKESPLLQQWLWPCSPIIHSIPCKSPNPKSSPSRDADFFRKENTEAAYLSTQRNA